MRIGILAGVGRDWRESIEKVHIAEALGYELVAAGESWGPSTVPWMTLLAAHTHGIQIGTSILNVYSRSPGAIAQEFAMLEMLSGGRMVCGLGSSGHRVIEHFHGVPFERPLRRIRETVEIVNLLIKGERLDYQGEIFNMQRGFRLDYDRPSPHFSPGAVMIAEDFGPVVHNGHVRVLATESIAGTTVEGARARTARVYTGPKDPRGRGQRSPPSARSSTSRSN